MVVMQYCTITPLSYHDPKFYFYFIYIFIYLHLTNNLTNLQFVKKGD